MEKQDHDHAEAMSTPARSVDGNDVLAVYEAARWAPRLGYGPTVPLPARLRACAPENWESTGGRLGHPTDIAAAALFLASEESGFITGQTLSVNGGLLMV